MLTASSLSILLSLALSQPPAAVKVVDEDPAIAAIDAFIAKQELDTKSAEWRTKVPRPELAKFPAGTDYHWRLTTNKGDILIELMPDVAPMHVTSTIYLTRLGFYDDLAFHRVIPGFMAQGGCPLGTGSGGPAYKYASEVDPKVRHNRPGLLSMANTGRPSSDGSQFFLTFVPTPHLDGKHTIFGEIIEGMDTLKKLEAAGTRGSGQTREPLKIVKATIEAVSFEPLPSAADGDDPALQATADYIKKKGINREIPSWKRQLPLYPELTFTEGQDYFWNLQTRKGVIKVKLMPKVAPNHVANTIYLSRLGFYDGLIFHRIMANFMAQGGCPRGDGFGHPGYQFDGEFAEGVGHSKPGMLSTANSGPGTDGSQFFLTFVPTPHLDGKHTIYGEVVEGMDVLEKINAAANEAAKTRQTIKVDIVQTTITLK